MHTTASDGRCTPEELVDRAAGVGIRVMSVTDHDTLAGCPAAAAADARGITVLPGIEITSIHASPSPADPMITARAFAGRSSLA